MMKKLNYQEQEPGTPLSNLLNTIIKNQNEIIDWIEKHDTRPKPFDNNTIIGPGLRPKPPKLSEKTKRTFNRIWRKI